MRRLIQFVGVLIICVGVAILVIAVGDRGHGEPSKTANTVMGFCFLGGFGIYVIGRLWPDSNRNR